MMNVDEIESVLDERRQSFESCTSEDALAEPVDTSKFYRFVSSITDIDIDERGEVSVQFYEPVPGATNLDRGYKYRVTVGREQLLEQHGRCEMPRDDLITLQQVSIVIWSMANGLLGNPNE